MHAYFDGGGNRSIPNGPTHIPVWILYPIHTLMYPEVQYISQMGPHTSYCGYNIQYILSNILNSNIHPKVRYTHPTVDRTSNTCSLHASHRTMYIHKGIFTSQLSPSHIPQLLWEISKNVRNMYFFNKWALFFFEWSIS